MGLRWGGGGGRGTGVCCIVIKRDSKMVWSPEFNVASWSCRRRAHEFDHHIYLNKTNSAAGVSRSGSAPE